MTASPYLFILTADREVIQAPDANTWGVWMATADRKVGLDEAPGWSVSTVFIGIDPMAAIVDAPPRVFESLITTDATQLPRPVGAPALESLDWSIRRYQTWTEAAAGHAQLVAQLKTLFTTH